MAHASVIDSIATAGLRNTRATYGDVNDRWTPKPDQVRRVLLTGSKDGLGSQIGFRQASIKRQRRSQNLTRLITLYS